MNILVTYDVDTVSERGQNRLRKVAQICKDYGQRVQNSVFECDVSETQYLVLREELKEAMNVELDSIRFYQLNKNKSHGLETLGRITSYDYDEPIVL